MGYYIQVEGNLNKARKIIDQFRAEEVSRPIALEDVPEDKALICVVNNGLWEGAVLVYNQSEFDKFSRLDDSRPHTWLLMDKDWAYEVAKFPG